MFTLQSTMSNSQSALTRVISLACLIVLAAAPVMAMAGKPSGFIPDLTVDPPTPIPTPTLPPYVAPVYVSSTTVHEEGEPWILKDGRKVYPKAVIHDYFRDYKGATRIHEKKIQRAASPHSDVVVENHFYTKRDYIPGVLDLPFLPGTHPLAQYALIFFKGTKEIKRIKKQYLYPAMAQSVEPKRVVVLLGSMESNYVVLESFSLEGISEGQILVYETYLDEYTGYSLNDTGELANISLDGVGRFVNFESRRVWNVEDILKKKRAVGKFWFVGSEVKVLVADNENKQTIQLLLDAHGKVQSQSTEEWKK